MELARLDITNSKKVSEENRGYLKKYWIELNNYYLVKYNDCLLEDQDIMEYFISKVHKINNVDTVNVKLAHHQTLGNCCLVESFLKENEVLLEMDSRVAGYKKRTVEYNISRAFWIVFGKFNMLENIEDIENNCLKESYIKMIFSDCIVCNQDRKLRNVGIVYDEVKQTRRLTPLYDNGLAFGSFPSKESPTVHVANEEFYKEDVLKFILKHNLDVVYDIACNFINNYDVILDELNTLGDFLHCDKKDFIIKNLEETKTILNTYIIKKDNYSLSK